MDVDSDTPFISIDNDTPAANDGDGDGDASDEQAPSSSGGSASGRWKDDTVGAAASVFKDMDELLNQFCATHEIPFSRAFKTYLKGHSAKAPGENPWNTYTKLHAHQDHKERELARVGYTIEGFQLLDLEEQQKLRARCWKEFQQSFDSPTECNASLDIFRQFSACEDKEKGMSIARRRKLFDGLLNKLA
ncbi:hypothetical protein FIBSPDRAFT_967813 [Athelia psychrophila]|uniref:Uncharacterized protein n=1 Tax=Athelia psychrophila TaxID=1759441 RepID=A0A167VAV8_9AGAM|nr:hypothetical protein FIBSPDRAFT_967813 [Fibularhizoctonia sp. CBS 109695]